MLAVEVTTNKSRRRSNRRTTTHEHESDIGALAPMAGCPSTLPSAQSLPEGPHAFDPIRKTPHRSKTRLFLRRVLFTVLATQVISGGLTTLLVPDLYQRASRSLP